MPMMIRSKGVTESWLLSGILIKIQIIQKNARGKVPDPNSRFYRYKVEEALMD